jgi:hypothetical protein
MTAQPLLFTDLPTTDRVRKSPRRSRVTSIAAPVAVDLVREPARLPPPANRPAFPPAPVTASFDLVPPGPPPPFDPAALSNPELRALVQALPDQKLSHLLIEAARELKRRALPDRDPADSDDPDATVVEPNPVLLRAARQVVGELSGDDS